MKRCVAILILVLLVFVGCGGREAGKNAIQVYIPCGMLEPFKEIKKMFKVSHPDVEVNDRYDNAITLARDVLKKGHRPDIFVSPGEKEMSLLEDRNLIDETTKKAFGTYNLVLVVPEDNPAGIKVVEDLADARVHTIALSDPRYNSVGAYAKEALETLGLWDKLEKKFVFTNDPYAALAVVGRGKAQAGMHYESCPFQTTPEKLPAQPLKIIQRIPARTHQPVECLIAVLKTSKKKELAQKFIDFILSKPVQAKFKELGLPNLPKLRNKRVR